MSKKITQAFILSAGLGTRLRPITDTIPKVMVPIAPGKPLLEHEIEVLRDQGVTDFIINVHYLPDVITSYFGDGKKLGVRIVYSDEREQALETGGAIKKAAHLLDENFFFLHGDELYFFDVTPVAKRHFESRALTTIVLKTSDIPANGEIAEFDPETGCILKWHVRPHGIPAFRKNLMMNSAIKAMSKRILTYITEPEGVPVKLDAQVFPRALAAGELLLALPTTEPILDIGNPEKYAFAKEYYQKQKK